MVVNKFQVECENFLGNLKPNTKALKVFHRSLLVKCKPFRFLKLERFEKNINY
ncbi:MAG: hypothetical protein OHK0038_19360 [Flammeovirgaceae bacterium]